MKQKCNSLFRKIWMLKLVVICTILQIIYSCSASNQIEGGKVFTKRRYLKGYYINKTSRIKSLKIETVSINNSDLPDSIQIIKKVSSSHHAKSQLTENNLPNENQPIFKVHDSINLELITFKNRSKDDLLKNNRNSKKKTTTGLVVNEEKKLKSSEREMKSFGVFTVFLMGFIAAFIVGPIMVLIFILLNSNRLGSRILDHKKPKIKTFRNVFLWGFLKGLDFFFSLVFWFLTFCIIYWIFLSFGWIGVLVAIVTFMLLLFLILKLLDSFIKVLLPIMFIGWGRNET